MYFETSRRSPVSNDYTLGKRIGRYTRSHLLLLTNRGSSCIVNLGTRKTDSHLVAIKTIEKNPEKEVETRREVWLWQKALQGEGHKVLIALYEVCLVECESLTSRYTNQIPK